MRCLLSTHFSIFAEAALEVDIGAANRIWHCEVAKDQQESLVQSISDILGANEFNLIPHAIALLIAYILALPIGWNREREERSAGLRTFPLVAVSTCGLIQAAETLTAASPEAMARIVEGLITGVGFIGGGAILRLKDSVKGTATAASLWVTGAIGASVGLGSYDVALILSLVTLATLWMMPPLKRNVESSDIKDDIA
jgi:putative Mg2+ transporter-C (MgtC) family protein